MPVSSLRDRFGDRSSNWRWNDIHAAKFWHALAGGGRLLDWFFSRGPVPVAGDNMTVNKTTTNLRRPYETSEAASYRQILDVGAWDRSVAVNTTGQSGHPRSPHYFDQNSLWRQGRYRSLPFTREAVDRATESQLELMPGHRGRPTMAGGGGKQGAGFHARQSGSRKRDAQSGAQEGQCGPRIFSRCVQRHLYERDVQLSRQHEQFHERERQRARHQHRHVFRPEGVG